MLDKLSELLFGPTGERITKWGIALCGVVFLAELIGHII